MYRSFSLLTLNICRRSASKRTSVQAWFWFLPLLTLITCCAPGYYEKNRSRG